jgi:hypothetical protein
MKQSPLFLLRLIVLPILGAVSFSAAAQTTAQGFYYPPSAWDLQLQCNTHATCPRFVVLSNWIDTSHPSGGAAVLDRETGLVWEQSPSTTPLQWGGPGVPMLTSAQFHCNNMNVGNRKGYRLPTLQELTSLVDPTRSPALPAGHPFSNVQTGFYWSATTSASDAGFTWTVGFAGGGVSGDVGVKNSSLGFAWCVRGGQGVDPQ